MDLDLNQFNSLCPLLFKKLRIQWLWFNIATQSASFEQTLTEKLMRLKRKIVILFLCKKKIDKKEVLDVWWSDYSIADDVSVNDDENEVTVGLVLYDV